MPANSTLTARPAKPREDFPLFPHRNGRWAKKVRGSFCYFGKWADDPKGEAAVNLWLDQKDELLAGRKPRGNREGLTIKMLCDRVCASKEQQKDAGTITNRQWKDCYNAAALVVDSFGRGRLVEDLGPDDFDGLYSALVKKNTTRIRWLMWCSGSAWSSHMRTRTS